MDNTETHYLTYDSEEMFQEMNLAYIEAGGDVLYPGDEKEMLLRGVLSILMQAFAAVDNALRMDTLRYAQREYLEIYGEKRNCVYNAATAAKATISITFKATGSTETIQAGETVTADGQVLYKLKSDVLDGGIAQTVSCEVECTRAGAFGNGLLSGTQMQFMATHDGVESVVCAVDASGGQDDEDYEAYRERIRTYGLTSVTAGPAEQYEAAAMAVTSEILDANAIQPSAGQVNVYLRLASGASSAAIIAAVTEALSPQSARPLTDYVTVLEATAVNYTLNVQYQVDEGSDVAAALAAAKDEYQAWQDTTIGRAFNPDRLMAALYQAGATRVAWGDGSNFDSGTVEYTPIDANEYCSGTITLAVMDDD